MPELLGVGALQTLFDAYLRLFQRLVRTHDRSWRALAKILRGDRGFRDVDRIFQRHPYLVRALMGFKTLETNPVRTSRLAA